MRRFIAAATIIVAVGIGAGQADAEEKPSPCPGRGLGSQYLVPNAHVAMTIYRAIASALAPQNLKKYPIIITKDLGDHWGVSQTNNAPPPKPQPNTVIITAGGGQLDMTIDKCTGAISDAVFNR